ncbi:DUF1622 domain-containing protein [Streptomyces galbus]|uniref:DUF1622 domain-containing protein n=1 Tax=Streptomyces galbus TaxID=33898 RepID=A0A4U5WVW5_STRGB|nr:DUF1622 domain-containing protein [Streptomyces galbus]TKT06634.1 DUF1622 domain-containing protein [Streptomyces galbus]GHD53572.1 hypothetical protein GCM10010335_67220 [Streptomyces galbus]
MNGWLQMAAVLITALGLVAAAAAWRLTHTVRGGLAVLLDFLTAAGLIRLAGEPSWGSVMLAAAVIALRKLLGASLHVSRPNQTTRGGARPVSAGR